MKDGDIKEEFCKYVLSETEKKELAQRMAQEIADLSRTESEKKAVASDFKSQIDALQTKITQAATRLNNGYDMRYIECKVVADWDGKTWVTYRLDNGEQARERRMSAEDLQRRIDAPGQN